MLLEFDALLAQVEAVAEEGDGERFDSDARFRWVLQRLWIAVGNEALTYVRLVGRNPQADQPWARLYRLRNMLAHDRLPDIDEDEVWRVTAVRTSSLRAQVRELLN